MTAPGWRDEARPLGPGVAVAGGLDVDLAGTGGVRLRATVWDPSGGPARTGATAALGPPVLLLHGLASQRRFWNLVVPGLLAAGVRVAALDQRGHGDSDRPAGGPYDVRTCAADALAAAAELLMERPLLVGHSWGAAVALAAAAAAGPADVAACVALDGGVSTPAGLGTREEVRRRLEPPRLALPPDQVERLVARGPLGPVWTSAHADAVLPAFAVGPDGLARARLGLDLHLQVLDGLLDHDVATTLAGVGCPCWVVSCEPGGAEATDPAYHDDGWARVRAEGLARAERLLARPRIMRWAGAVHDVPLQWPELVAGLVLAARAEAVRTGAGSKAPDEAGVGGGGG